MSPYLLSSLQFVSETAGPERSLRLTCINHAVWSGPVWSGLGSVFSCPQTRRVRRSYRELRVSAHVPLAIESSRTALKRFDVGSSQNIPRSIPYNLVQGSRRGRRRATLGEPEMFWVRFSRNGRQDTMIQEVGAQGGLGAAAGCGRCVLSV